jgi:hypothetical protein
MEHQKILVQTRDENMETEVLSSPFRYLMRASILLGQARRKGDFVLLTLFFYKIRDN